MKIINTTLSLVFGLNLVLGAAEPVRVESPREATEQQVQEFAPLPPNRDGGNFRTQPLSGGGAKWAGRRTAFVAQAPDFDPSALRPGAPAPHPDGGGFGTGSGASGKAVDAAMRNFATLTSQFNKMQIIHDGADRQGRTLVVRSGDTDPKSMSIAQEDLNVMSHILEKAADKRGDDEERRAMGVPLVSFGEGVKNLLLEGYGAVFLLNVNFPLSGPPEKGKETEPKAGADSTWEEAKRELYGPRGPKPGGNWEMTQQTPLMEPYNPKRVESLKAALLEALKNAANIRSLKEDDSVTVVVTTRGTGPTLMTRKIAISREQPEDAPAPGAGIETEDHIKPVPHPKSTLTIRVKKGDIDAFAKGKMNEEAFRKKVAIALY
jgi:hypothetical protein